MFLGSTLQAITLWYNRGVNRNQGYVHENTEKWLELCKEASTEQDPERLMKLTAEILRLLDENDKRLRDHSGGQSAD
jgi:hypothetical protein